uniref:Uncharacterized protein n=1 Tax=Arundo donax TaxID=35708 RepID=A0A0A8Z055_ARUDO
MTRHAPRGKHGCLGWADDELELKLRSRLLREEEREK